MNKVVRVSQKHLQINVASAAVRLRPCVMLRVIRLERHERHVELMQPVQVHHFVAGLAIVAEDVQNLRECSWESSTRCIHTEIQPHTFCTALFVRVRQRIEHAAPGLAFLVPAFDRSAEQRMLLRAQLALAVPRFHEQHAASVAQQFVQTHLHLERFRAATEKRLVFLGNEVDLLGLGTFSVNHIP